MLNQSNLYSHQKRAIKFISDTNKCALFLDMGLGKTIISLTAARNLLDEFYICNVLVIAPLRVVTSVWKQEAAQWEHLKGLTIEIVTGSEKKRNESLNTQADIYVISRDNIDWLVKNHKWCWDMLIIDESSSFKNPSSKRFKALKKVSKDIVCTVLLSGTPAPNSLLDLWSQMYLLDSGERLGRTMRSYKANYFMSTGYCGYVYKPLPDSDKAIKNKIKDITLSMQADDYISLPKKININEVVTLDKDSASKYKQLEKDFITILEDVTVKAPSKAILGVKLLQLANGALYDEDKVAHVIHNAKIDAVRDVIELNQNDNIIVAYNFNFDLRALQEAFPDGEKLENDPSLINRWNLGKIRLLFAHPQSAGYGLNLQKGGSMIVWYGMNWSLELYHQFNGRLHRQGQTKPVRIIHALAKGTIDEKILKVLGSKASVQNNLLDGLKREYRDG